MRRWVGAIAINLISICVVVEFIREFSANDSIRYFSDQPRRLLCVLAIAGACGVLVWAFNRLPLAIRRGLAFLWRYIVALLVAYLAAWAGAFIYLCRSIGVSVKWDSYWLYLFMSWSSDGRKTANLVWAEGSRLMDQAWLGSVIGFIPLAVLATVLAHKMGRQKPDEA